MDTDVKRLLASRSRSLRRYPGKLLLGPTGSRLWADYLDAAPGFKGRIDFIHKLNVPLLYTVKPCCEEEPSPVESVWYPDELRLECECGAYRFSERKLITWQDAAVSVQHWENLSGEELTLECVLPENARESQAYTFPVKLHGLNVIMVFRADAAFSSGRLVLRPGEQRTLLLAAALGLEGEEASLYSGLEELFSYKGSADELLDGYCEKYLSWFEDAPEFECSDAYITRCWWYRIYILRACLARPASGYLKHEMFYEGRGHKMGKTPYAPTGWEFSRLIPLSTPLTMMDMRWIKRPDVGKAAFRALVDSVNAEGAFSVCSADSKGKEYTNFAAWALYSYYLLWGDEPFIREVIEDFKRDCRSVFERHKGNDDSLQVCYAHALTGKEYQPGFWYFAPNGFPRNVRGSQEGYTPLKRVDSSVYMYLNCLGLSLLCRALGDADAQEFGARASDVRRGILDKMWDEETGCFYDLHYQTGEKARVKHIVSVYPLWAGITGAEHLRQIDCLLDPALFSRGSGFASTAADCAAYSPSGGWMGDYFKGRDGCMWNGPSWPYTTGIALDALARQSKLHSHIYDGAFSKHFREYTLEHFRFGDIAQPYLTEHYDAETGEALSDEADYNHSFYLDLVVRHLCGLEPQADALVFEPLDMGLTYFSIKGVYVRGHKADVYYQRREGARYKGLKAGYTLFIDGVKRLDGAGGQHIRRVYELH